MLFPVISNGNGNRIMVMAARSGTVKYNTVGKSYDGNNDNDVNKEIVITSCTINSIDIYDKSIFRF